VEKQENRIVTVFTANRDPLFDPADGDISGFVNALYRVNGVVFRIPAPDEREYFVTITCILRRGCGFAGKRMRAALTTELRSVLILMAEVYGSRIPQVPLTLGKFRSP
jgi:hypothetical protein